MLHFFRFFRKYLIKNEKKGSIQPMHHLKRAQTNAYQQLAENAYLLLFGGVLYAWLEVLYRGHTHWSMGICGGVCTWAIYRINERFQHSSVLFRALLGALTVTCAELVTGCAVNLWLGLGVWDYSRLPFNLWGQICIGYSVIWFLLCLPVGALCGVIRRRVFLYES